MSASQTFSHLPFPLGANLFAPRPAARHLQLASAFYSNRQLSEAEHHFRAAQASDPASRDAVMGLAAIMIETGRPQDAVTLLTAALSRSFDPAPVHSALAIAYDLLRHYDEAVAQFERSLSLRPADEGTLVNFGNTLSKLNRALEQIPWLERAIAAAPRTAALQVMLAKVLMGIGRFDEARQRIEQAIAIEPRKTYFYRLLAEVKRFEPGDRHLAAMEALVHSTGG